MGGLSLGVSGLDHYLEEGLLKLWVKKETCKKQLSIVSLVV